MQGNALLFEGVPDEVSEHSSDITIARILIESKGLERRGTSCHVPAYQGIALYQSRSIVLHRQIDRYSD